MGRGNTDLSERTAQALVGLISGAGKAGKDFITSEQGQSIGKFGQGLKGLNTQNVLADIVKLIAGGNEKGISPKIAEANEIASEVAINTAKKGIKDQVQKMIDSGIPPEQIIETSIGAGARQTGDIGVTPQSRQRRAADFKQQAQDTQGQQQVVPESSALAGAQPQQQPSQPQQIGFGSPVAGGARNVGKMLMDILTLGGTFESPTAAARGLAREQAATLKQEREEGLTEAKREEIGLVTQRDLIKESIKQANELSKQGTLKPQDLFTSFQKASEPFVKVRDAMGRIEASAQDPTAAGDLALIFNYMKVLDPGSTVREGEFANAQNSGSVPAKIIAQYNKVISGQRLSGGQRGDFVDRARRLFKASERQQKQNVQQHTKLANKNRINPNVFITDLGLAQDTSETPTREQQVNSRIAELEAKSLRKAGI